MIESYMQPSWDSALGQYFISKQKHIAFTKSVFAVPCSEKIKIIARRLLAALVIFYYTFIDLNRWLWRSLTCSIDYGHVKYLISTITGASSGLVRMTFGYLPQVSIQKGLRKDSNIVDICIQKDDANTLELVLKKRQIDLNPALSNALRQKKWKVTETLLSRKAKPSTDDLCKVVEEDDLLAARLLFRYLNPNGLIPYNQYQLPPLLFLCFRQSGPFSERMAQIIVRAGAILRENEFQKLSHFITVFETNPRQISKLRASNNIYLKIFQDYLDVGNLAKIIVGFKSLLKAKPLLDDAKKKSRELAAMKLGFFIAKARKEKVALAKLYNFEVLHTYIAGYLI